MTGTLTAMKCFSVGNRFIRGAHGYTSFNIGAVIRAPRPESRLAERMLDERQISSLLDAVASHPREHALIRLLYNGEFRVSAVVSLQWRNLVGGIINVRGKGGRSSVVRLSLGTWNELKALRPADAQSDDRILPMSAWNAVGPRAARGLQGRTRGARLTALPAVLSWHACVAPRRGSRNRPRHAWAWFACDDRALSACAAGEV